jgi:hypothetical protein
VTGRRALMVGLALLGATATAHAEPYLAIQKGLKCMVCHTSPSGGGKRTAYGNVFAQQEMAARLLGGENGKYKYWTGEVTRWLAVGADLRGGWEELRTPGQPDSTATELQELLAYGELRLWPDRLMFYIDARLRPDDPLVREQYLRLSTSDGRLYVKGGEFFLPFGLRLQDDEAFIRQVPGINFNTPDTGWELGAELGDWSAQLAITRGTAGGPEIDSGKQYSLLLSLVRPDWHVGGSFNFNDAAVGDRQMQNLFAGLRTGRITWLGEIDYIIDEGTPTGRRKLWMSLLEANIQIRRAHNLKLTIEYLDPDVDVDNDQQNRASIVWEYSPMQFLQTRAGYRNYDGIPQNPAQNRKQLFVELHALF